MFNPDKALKDNIFDILNNDGKSISALSRDLEGRGISIHRLILTGYLRALTDYNYLKEKEVPPAKVYVPVKGKEKDIYEVVGEFSRRLENGPDADLLILYSLNRLFRRPVFFEELRKAGLRDMPSAKQVGIEERQEAKKFIQKARLKVSDMNLIYYHDDPALASKYEELLSMILCDLLSFSSLVRDTKQTKLDFSQPVP
ncbi:MAG: hypothetical protein SA339_10845 [Methanomassiliicoccus sp.]|nr:hypothetical protein [Methanomassiliicoccus sp.]